MSSTHVTHLLTDFIDDTLPKGGLEKFKAHLTFCNACRQALTEIRRNIDVLRGTPAAPPPAGLEKRVAAGMVEMPRAATKSAAKEAGAPKSVPTPAKEHAANGVADSMDTGARRSNKPGYVFGGILIVGAALIVWRLLPGGHQEELPPTAASVEKAPEAAKVEPPPAVAPPAAKAAAERPNEPAAAKEAARPAEKPAPVSNNLPWAAASKEAVAPPPAPAAVKPNVEVAKPVEPVKAVPLTAPAKSAGAAPPVVAKPVESVKAVAPPAVKAAEAPKPAEPAKPVEAAKAASAASAASASAMAGSFSSITEAKQLVVSDEAAWKDLWSRHTQGIANPPAMPAVDFGSKEVIALFGGEQATGGRRIEIMAMEDTGWNGETARLVRYRIAGPPAGAVVTQSITHPFQFKIVPRISGKTYFEKAP